MGKSATWCGLVAGLLAMVACAGPEKTLRPNTDFQGPARWSYALAPRADLSGLWARLCFADKRPEALVANNGRLAASILIAEERTEEGWSPIANEGARYPLQGTGRPGCIRYFISADSFDDTQMGAEDFFQAFQAWALPADLPFLWPVAARQNFDVDVVFDLPAGLAISHPFPAARRPRHFKVQPSVFGFTGTIVFGRFQLEHHRPRLNDTSFAVDVAVMGRIPPDAHAHRSRWILDAYAALRQLYSNPVGSRVQLLMLWAVVPMRRSGILGGMSWRGGGPAIWVVADARTGKEGMEQDWVLLHEMLHHNMPYAPRDERWLTEGLATYYQWVLKARAGQITPKKAWEQLAWGLRRTLSGKSARASSYWKGVAFALRLDLQIRRLSQGELSLDDAMRFFRLMALPPTTLRPDQMVDFILDRFTPPGTERPPDWDVEWTDAALLNLGLGEDQSDPDAWQNAPWATLRNAITQAH